MQRKKVIIAGIVVIVFLIGIGGWFYMQKPRINPNLTEKTQFVPVTSYSKWPYHTIGQGLFGGFMDYLALLNERDDGINGIKLEWKDCATGYQVSQALECYELYKDYASGAPMFNFVSTPVIYALMPRTTHDKIPQLTIGLGASMTADGRVFPYIFPLTTTYWNQNTAKIKFIASREKGMDKLKGKIIANVYQHSEYGTETAPILDKQAEKYGFTVKYFPVEEPGLHQDSVWSQVQRLKPDWIIIRATGIMNQEMLKGIDKINFPMNRVVGVWWIGSEEDVEPLGEKAKGYFAAGNHPSGRNFRIIQQIEKYVYAKGSGHVTDKKTIGTIYYNRGVIHGILNTEAIRKAQERYGHRPLRGEEVRWGLENLNLTSQRIKELTGYEDFMPPIKTSCRDHEGRGKVHFQQWDGEKWNIVSDWITPDYDLTEPMVKAEAEKYAKEHGIIMQDCE